MLQSLIGLDSEGPQPFVWLNADGRTRVLETQDANLLEGVFEFSEKNKLVTLKEDKIFLKKPN